MSGGPASRTAEVPQPARKITAAREKRKGCEDFVKSAICVKQEMGYDEGGEYWKRMWNLWQVEHKGTETGGIINISRIKLDLHKVPLLR